MSLFYVIFAFFVLTGIAGMIWMTVRLIRHPNPPTGGFGAIIILGVVLLVSLLTVAVFPPKLAEAQSDPNGMRNVLVIQYGDGAIMNCWQAPLVRKTRFGIEVHAQYVVIVPDATLLPIPKGKTFRDMMPHLNVDPRWCVGGSYRPGKRARAEETPTETGDPGEQ